MANKFRRGGNGLWSIKERVNGKQCVWATGTTDADQAEAMRLKVELALAEHKDPSLVFGMPFQLKGQETPLAAVIERYAKQADIKANTLRLNRYSWAKFMKMTGVSTVEGAQAEDILKRFKDASMKEPGRVGKKMAAAYIGLVLRDMNKLMAFAVQCGVASVNRFAGAAQPLREEVFRVLKEDEEERILAASEGVMRRVIQIELATGLRLEQLASMDWKQYDRRNKLLTVAPQKRQKERQIPIFDETLSLMGTPEDRGPVFKEFDGKTLDQIKWQIEQNWQQIKKKAGIKGRLRFHDLRHTCASRVAQKLNSAEVRDFFGWSSISMVDRYVHTRVEDIRKKLSE